MTKCSKPLSPEKVAEYYLHEFSAADQNNYYSQGKALAGTWHGKLAESFGLHGSVREDHYVRLASGKCPNTSEQLIRHQKNGTGQPWEKKTVAWRGHLEELFCKGILEGKDIFRESSDGILRQSRKGADRVEPLADQPITERGAKLIEMHRLAAQTYQENLAGTGVESAREYLAKRNVSAESVQEFGLGASTGGDQLVQKLEHFGPELMEASGLFRKDRVGRWHDRFENRLMFPIQNRAGEIVGFGARKLDENTFGPKYINSPSTEIYQKGEMLYNAHRAADPAAKKDQITVVEGYFDVIAAHQSGMRNVVASSGTALDAETVQTLSRNVVLNLDGDATGRDAAVKHSAELLKAGLRVRVADMRGYDPDEYIEDHGAESYRKKVEKARPLVEWLAARAKAKFIEDAPPARRAEATADAVHWIVDVLANVKSEDRGIMSAEIAAYLKVDQGLMEVPKHSEHISAWDITIAPHKSYSVTALVGGDKGLIDDHNEAIRIALDAGQEYTQARMGNNNAPLTTGNWACAVFRHDSARPVGANAPNPHLHSHCVVFNMTDADGQKRAVKAGEIFKVQTYMDAIYQSETAYRARARGYELEHGKNFSTRIKGYSDEYLLSVSARSEEIEKEKAALGLVGAEADERINKRLRQPKREWQPEALWAEHRRQALEMDNHPDQVVAKAKEGHSYLLPEEQCRRFAHEAIDYAKNRLYEGQAVVDKFEIIRDALRFGLGYLRLEDVKAAFEERLAQKEAEFVEVHHYREGAPGARYSTEKHRAMEFDILRMSLDGKGVTDPILHTSMTREEYRNRYKERMIDGKKVTLNNSQMWMSWKALTEQSRHMIVHGFAGVGKSFATQPIAELATESGYEVRGLAPTGKAALNLEGIGIPCQTVQAHIARSKFGEKEEIPQRRLYILDEGSLMSSQDMYDFQCSMRPCDRAIYAYDPGQHQSVGAGRIVETMEEAGVPTFNMKQIVRQRERPELLAVVENMATGKHIEALKMLQEQGRIFEYENRKKRFAATARYYAANFGACSVVTPDNRSIKEMDVAIRLEMRNREILGPDVYEGSIMVGLRDIREADRRCAGRYSAGDVIRFGKEVEFLGVCSGQYATVKKVDAEKNFLTIEVATRLGTREMTYDPRQAYGVEIFTTEKRTFAVGERVQITRPWKLSPGVKIANRSTGIIQELDANGNCRLELEGERKRQLRFNLKEMPHVDYAYALTSYSQQCITSEKVIVHIDTQDTQARSVTDQALLYVGSSRGSKEIIIVTNSREELLGPESPVLRITLKPKAHAKHEIESLAKVKVA